MRSLIRRHASSLWAHAVPSVRLLPSQRGVARTEAGPGTPDGVSPVRRLLVLSSLMLAIYVCKGVVAECMYTRSNFATYGFTVAAIDLLVFSGLAALQRLVSSVWAPSAAAAAARRVSSPAPLNNDTATDAAPPKAHQGAILPTFRLPSSARLGRSVRAQLPGLVLIGALLAANLGLGNLSMAHGVSFPSKVIGRSSKLLPTMAFGLINGRRFVAREYVSACALIAGLATFSLARVTSPAAADAAPTAAIGAIAAPSGTAAASDGMTWAWAGVLLLLSSVVAEAVQSNLQERLLQRGHMSVVQLMIWANGMGCTVLLVWTSLSGELWSAASLLIQDPVLLLLVLVEALFGFIGLQVYLTVVLGTLRKVFTIVLSFILFPKPFSYAYVVGTVFVLSGTVLKSGSAPLLNIATTASSYPPLSWCCNTNNDRPRHPRWGKRVWA